MCKIVKFGRNEVNAADGAMTNDPRSAKDVESLQKFGSGQILGGVGVEIVDHGKERFDLFLEL